MTNLTQHIKNWNTRLSNDPLATEYDHKLRTSLLTKKFVYRLNPERIQRLHKTAASFSTGSMVNKTVGLQGTPYIELAPHLALRPAFITEVMEQQLINMGNILCKVIDVSAQFVQDNEMVCSVVAKSPRAEASGVTIKPSHRRYAPIIRTDYLWVPTATEPHPVIVDINLVPGATQICHGITNVFEELFANDLKELGNIRGYRANEICQVIREEYEVWQKIHSSTTNPPRFAFVIREGHGLVPEMIHWTKMFQDQTGLTAAIVYVDQIKSVKNGIIYTDLGEFNAMVRMVRPITKHVEPNRVAIENKVVQEIMAAYYNGELFVLPGFHVYLENHAWTHIWRSEKYGSFFREALGNEDYNTLCWNLPATALTNIYDEQALLLEWDDGTTTTCSNEMPNDHVIKRGDSTGAEGLYILKHSSTKHRQQAYAYTRQAINDGIVIQKLINGTKEIYPVVGEGKNNVELVEGFMKYSAFYANGKYLGGSAMMCPESRKVHGGSGTYLMPVFTLPS